VTTLQVTLQLGTNGLLRTPPHRSSPTNPVHIGNEGSIPPATIVAPGEYDRMGRIGRDPEHHPDMKKRILATFLWFYAGWYAGAILAEMLGVSQLLGPIVGMAAAALVAGDPRRIIWTSRPAAPVTATTQEPT
jgi:hypothetical protein